MRTADKAGWVREYCDTTNSATHAMPSGSDTGMCARQTKQSEPSANINARARVALKSGEIGNVDGQTMNSAIKPIVTAVSSHLRVSKPSNPAMATTTYIFISIGSVHSEPLTATG